MANQETEAASPKYWRLFELGMAAIYAASICTIVAIFHHPEWHEHLLRITGRAWDVFVAQDVGSTSRGFLSGGLEAFLGIAAVAAMTGYFLGWRELQKHWLETAIIALFAFPTVTLVVYGTQFAWEIAKAGYDDHHDLTESNERASQKLAISEKEVARLQSLIPKSTKTTVPRWNEPPSAQSGPIGPIAAVELVSAFRKPCVVAVTASKDKPNLKSTIMWLLTQASGCETYDAGLPSTDASYPKKTEPRGMVIHWNENNRSGEQIARFFEADGYIVRVSHQLPPNSPPLLIWIEFGPGSPVRDDIALGHR